MFQHFDVPGLSSRALPSYLKAGQMSSSTPGVLLNTIWIDYDRALFLGGFRLAGLN
jgi:hypothetical protein